MADDAEAVARQRRKEQDNHAVSNGHVTANSSSNPPAKTTKHTPSSQEPSIAVNIFSIYVPILSLIFFGCCSNVYTLESVINASPSCGPLLTLSQFLLVSLFSSSSCLSLSAAPPFIHLKPRKIPIRKWIVYTIMFAAINLLNNVAFGYKISVPLHIILRSAGPVTSMGVSYLFNNARYPKVKIFAVALLFFGVMLAALSDSYSKAPQAQRLASTSSLLDATPSKLDMLKHQAPGFVFLFLALLLSAALGLYTDKLYTQHGRSTQVTAESLFYSHTLSLPLFGLQLQSLASSFTTLATTSPPLSTSFAMQTKTLSPTSVVHQLLSTIPTALVMLFLNAFTQCICISGVNRLAAKSSSLTVSIVLNVRKLVSLLLSIWLFGNRLPPGVVAGAALVFMGGGLYAYPTKQTQPRQKVEQQGSIEGEEAKKEL